jgi:hypothetical protein
MAATLGGPDRATKFGLTEPTVEIVAQEEGFHLVLDGHSMILSRHTSLDRGVVAAASDQDQKSARA